MSTIFSANVGQLIGLQERDTKIDGLKKTGGEIPGRIAAVRAEYEAKKKEAEAQKESYKRAVVKKKELENDLQSTEALIRKHQMELNQVKSNEAFKALQAESDTLKKKADEIENAIIACLDEVDAAAKSEKALMEALKKEETASQQRAAELEKEKSALDAQITGLSVERDAFAGGINPDLLEKYDHLRKQLRGLAVVPSHDHPDGRITCGGCNMRLVPQDVVNLNKKDSFVVCDNCQRLLYSPKVLAESK